MQINKRVDTKNGTVQIQISDGSSIQIQTSEIKSSNKSNKWWHKILDIDNTLDDINNADATEDSDISDLLDEMSDVQDDIEDGENVEKNKQRFLDLMDKLKIAVEKKYGPVAVKKD